MTKSGNAQQDVYRISGVDCMDCALSMEKTLAKAKGIQNVKTSFFSSKLVVTYDSQLITDEEIIRKIKKLGYGVKKDYTVGREISKFAILELHCADCGMKIEKAISELEEVEKATINFMTSTLTVQHDIGLDLSHVISRVKKFGYDIRLQEAELDSEDSFPTRNWRPLLTVLSGLFIVLGLVSPWLELENLRLSLYLLAILTGGYYPARAGFYALRTFTLDINFLMIVAVAGAGYLEQWTEAAMVIFLFSLAEVLEAYAVEKSRRSIRSLLELTPEDVLVRKEDGEKRIPVEELREGDIFLVKPGERIATDGNILQGWSYIDQSPITGESTLVGKGEGDEVYGGTINQQGFLEVRATRHVSCNTLAEIIHLVEQAQTRKAAAQRFVDRFAKVYTPSVLVLALLVSVVPVLFFGLEFRSWFYKSLVLLVISCPCALVISTPITIVSAFTNAAKQGILIKGGNYLEALGGIQAIAFDKTGTITEGRPRVTQIIPRNGYSKAEVLRIAAGLERQSEHHIGKTILQKAQVEGITLPTEVGGFEAIKGKGAKGIIDGITYYVGSQVLLEEMIPATQRILGMGDVDGSTVVFVASEAEVIGVILLEDQPRDQSRRAIEALRQQGIEQVIMLTGDNEASAQTIARQVGITEVRAELLPDQKVEVIKDLLETYRTVAMVGDGVNDAPALATATVGVAMGGTGMDVSLETADIVLMNDDPASISHTVELGRRTVKGIHENISIALGLKIGVFILALLGLATLWMAVFADMGASLLVIMNSLRLLFIKYQIKEPPRIP